MNDSICLKFDVLREHLPDDLDKTGKIEFKKITNFNKYCPNGDCNSELDKITIGFLWLLEECYSAFKYKSHNKNNTNAFFLYMISWFSYKLKQNSEHSSTIINDFYNQHVKNSGKYNRFITDAYTIGDLKDFMDERNDFLNINIEDMSKFYDAFKILCNMYGNVAKNRTSDILLNNANDFVKTYIELNNKYNNNGAPHSKILSVLLTDYNNLKNGHTDFPSITAIEQKQHHAQSSGDNYGQSSEIISAQTSEVTSSNSLIGNKLFTVLSVFGAIAFFLGISYKYSLSGFRKRAQKQYLREKIKNIKKRMNHSYMIRRE
ncbi:Plasmodium variant antigen protein Cir/Yir/Bir, putative [Plasmodium berghei]|uniref:Plasmodium variant antigen protein Cir/Yir/Bir, putative n=1 Tax=Plasmodium berghei TaxID=5821 RepID=A0A1D3L6G2_PLABE|nr:Plasmodium variant antigen protein Cir/Yir/Bir, putative [Plasmodium berghei]